MPNIDISRPELIWPGKYDDNGNRVENCGTALPFQVIETIREGRATREPGRMSDLFSFATKQDESNWHNKLIWGDNLLVLASLMAEYAGKVDLIYIDPPFHAGADFSFKTKVGEETVEKSPSLLEEKAYRDTWGGGIATYLDMLYARLVVARNLLSPTGSLYVHLDHNVSHYAKVMLDDIMGRENYRNEVIWQRTSARSDSKTYNHIHDVIFLYTKSDSWKWTKQHTEYDPTYIENFYRYEDPDGRRFRVSDLTAAGTRKGSSGMPWRGIDPAARGNHWKYKIETLEELDKEGRIYWPKKEGGGPGYKRYLDEMPGTVLQSIWTDINPVGAQSNERTGYDTQKPEPLLERIIKASSEEDDLVLDFFCGSGTTAAVAEKLGRRWIACDLGRFAIHTTRKRMLDIPDCKPFEVLNLGKYERAYWQGGTFGEAPTEPNQAAIAAYIAFILELYKAQPLAGSHIHGKKGRALIHVGAVDAPVTISQVNEALAECATLGQKELHILGWEWEMGMNDPIIKHAQAEYGIGLRLLN
ncbi:MAG TPA: site-specific DNA-methyltransferase, partial [Bellilinea sp.]|nr:site-specific DNA-methyltransferase [Bellilinea sp.]